MHEEGELEFAQDEEEQYDDELLQEEGEQIAADNLATRVVRRGNRGAQHAEIVADEEPLALIHIPEEDEQVEVQAHLLLFSVTTTIAGNYSKSPPAKYPFCYILALYKET